jgi:uncharacterized lipoprotein YddW (UPF0748 family)
MKVSDAPRLSPQRSMSRPAPAAAPAPVAEQASADRVELSDTVEVKHRRELRGAWVATVWNINFPSSANLDADTQKREMRQMLDRLKECGFNSVFFQVRPEGDALYRSELEPMSHYLTGKQGKDPGYDPLAYLVEQAHQRNLEVHAWLNPYRASSSLRTEQVAPHIAVEHPEHVHTYDTTKWMDPGADVVREKLVDVCRDITKRYDVDGIHFDDYFYPYPKEGVTFPDQRTYAAYQAGGGKLSKDDWRRENVNRAVRDVQAAVREEKDYVRFGISPFGLPAPDKPEGTSGFNQYEGLYADTQKWMDEGWVDYLAPQLYWRTDQPKQAYDKLINWWADHSKEGRYIFAGNDLRALGSNPKWNVAEYRKQLELSRAKHPQGSQGNIWWNVAPLLENRQGINQVFQQEFYREPALTPALSTAKNQQVAAPNVTQNGRKVQLAHQDAAPLKAWTVYRQQGQEWKLDRILPGEQKELELPAGQWAIAAASKSGVESRGVLVSVS